MEEAVPENENAPVPILLLGDERLRQRCAELTREEITKPSAALTHSAQALAATLQDFRSRMGFGRAISAPQIGVSLRMIAMNLGDGPFFLFNPTITWCSEETMTLWDDCFSFPWLMVKVRRHRSISIEYDNEDGQRVVWDKLDPALSELLQHEIDHLDGILAVDHALDKYSLISRSVYVANQAKFDAQVDYFIVPTLGQARRRSSIDLGGGHQ